MTTTAVFLKSPSGLCIETEDNVIPLLLDAESADEFIVIKRQRDAADVIIPIENIASVVIGGHR